MPTTGRSKNVTRRTLAKELGKLGYPRRLSLKAIGAIVDLWCDALQRKEPVQLPMGWIIVKERRPRRSIGIRNKVADIPRGRPRWWPYFIRRKPKNREWIYAQPKQVPTS